MTRKSLVAIALLSTTHTVLADYDQFYFTTPSSNNLCKGMSFTCPPPQVCAHDSLTDVTYCCGTGASDAVCWTDANQCNGPNKSPASGQLGCANNSFCCRSGREQCTQRDGQINICWSVSVDPVANLSQNAVNNTFSSLSSASKAAKTLTVSIDKLLSATSSATTTPTNSPSTTPSSSPQTTLSSPSSTPTSNTTTNNNNTDASSSSITSGAIAGIVIGSIAGQALLGLAAFFLIRRQKNKSSPAKTSTELDDSSNPYASNPYYASQGYSAVAHHEMGPTPAEKYAHHAGAGVSEVHADEVRAPAEMAAGHEGAVEMEGSAPKRAA